MRRIERGAEGGKESEETRDCRGAARQQEQHGTKMRLLDRRGLSAGENFGSLLWVCVSLFFTFFILGHVRQ